MEEYFNQSDQEKKDSLPVAPFMDRDRVTKPTAQIGFIKYVLLPLFEALNKVKKKIILISHLLLRTYIEFIYIHFLCTLCSIFVFSPFHVHVQQIYILFFFLFKYIWKEIHMNICTISTCNICLQLYPEDR